MKHNSLRLALLIVLLETCCLALPARDIPFNNSGFEDGLQGWKAPKEDAGMSQASSEAVHNGLQGLLVTDADDEAGSELLSPYVPVEAGKTYRVRFWARIISGNGMGVFEVFYDVNKRPLNTHKRKNEVFVLLEHRFVEWKSYEIEGVAPEDAAYVGVRIHSMVKNKVTAQLDDFSIEEVDKEAEAKQTAALVREQLQPFPTASLEAWNAAHPGVVMTLQDIAPVCADTRVGFALMTKEKGQYVAFYAPDRRMTIGQRSLDNAAWKFKTLSSSVGYDNHNFIAMGFDRKGNLHVTGNMHAQPLVYFRTAKPGDIESLVAVSKMTGESEDRVTYPRFYNLSDGRLVFSYRQGASDNGKMFFNIYDEDTQSWKRLIDQPLFDGQDKHNAYPVELGPALGADGNYHLSWVWRDHPLCEANHDLSYARSRDLVHWETIDGKPITLPIIAQTPGVIVDPVPVKGGIINGTGRVGFDGNGKLYITYHKYDAQGFTQMYLATFENGSWHLDQASDWTYRWNFSGDGSIPFEIRLGKVEVINGTLGAFIQHIKYGSGFYKIDPTTKKIGDRVPGGEMPWNQQPLPEVLDRPQSSFPGMLVNWTPDTGQSPANTLYRLRWESLQTNRDKPPVKSPPPTMLRLLEIRKVSP